MRCLERQAARLRVPGQPADLATEALEPLAGAQGQPAGQGVPIAEGLPQRVELEVSTVAEPLPEEVRTEGRPAG